jgi:hypothetical protein
LFSDPIRLATSVTLFTAESVLDLAERAWNPAGSIEVDPAFLRRVLLTFETSIQGRIPEILGDDEDQRVETVVRLLRGSSEHDLNELIDVLQQALQELNDEKERRREDRARRRRREHRRRR